MSIPPNLSDVDLVAMVKKLPEVQFRTPDAATYHALKHIGWARELLVSETRATHAFCGGVVIETSSLETK